MELAAQPKWQAWLKSGSDTEKPATGELQVWPQWLTVPVTAGRDKKGSSECCSVRTRELLNAADMDRLCHGVLPGRGIISRTLLSELGWLPGSWAFRETMTVPRAPRR